MKNEKNIWAKELMSHIRMAKKWQELWLAEKEDEGAEHAYQELMDSEKDKVGGLLTLAREFGWITKEQQEELYGDMLDAIFD